jgi:hypothetical protein
MNKKNTIRLATVTGVSTCNREEAEILTIDHGWQVVAMKDSFSEGEEVIFVPSGSWIPNTLVSLTESGEYKGIKGGYLPTMKMAGEWSEGIVLKKDNYNPNDEARVWERDLPEEFQPESYRSYPTFIKNVEYSHAQDISKELFENCGNSKFEVTPRVNGIEMTVYVKAGRFGICSDKYCIDESTKNAFWKFAYDLNLPKSMVDYRDYYAIHGTIAGTDIYNNTEKMSDRRFFIHDIYDMESSEFMIPKERYKVFSDLAEGTGMHHVNVYQRNIKLSDIGLDMKSLHNHCQYYDDGKSMAPYSKRRGMIFKSCDSQFGFKIKSNMFYFANKL